MINILRLLFVLTDNLGMLSISLLLLELLHELNVICLVLVSLNSVIAVLDADFHSLPSIQHRQQHGPVCIHHVSIFKVQICLSCNHIR